MNRLVALLRPVPKAQDISSLDLRVPAVHGVRPRVIRAAKTAAVFARPRWIALHLVTWALAVTMVLLGRWQLDVSDRKHFDLQNFGYSLQWWAFAAFALFIWLRVMQYHLRPPDPPGGGGGLMLATKGQPTPVGPSQLVAPSAAPGQEPVVYRGYVMPQTSKRPVRSHGDKYHDIYNDYLWQLSLADGEVPRGASPDPGTGPAGQPDGRPSADPDEVPAPAIIPPDSDIRSPSQ